VQGCRAHHPLLLCQRRLLTVIETLAPESALSVLALLVVDITDTPGAASSTSLLKVENTAGEPVGSMAPTEITYSSDAGRLLLESPSLPAAAKNKMSFLRGCSKTTAVESCRAPAAAGRASAA
jgi:hypothetical protein